MAFHEVTALLVFLVYAQVGVAYVSANPERSSRRLLQDVKVIIPVYQDQSPCAAFNADDASPLVDKQNTPLGWATIQQGSLNSSSGLTSLQLDLTAHIAGLYLADSSSSQPDAANVRTCILTDVPDSCPATSWLMYHKADVADCSKRRATVEVPIPMHIFNCSYLSPRNYTTKFYVQLEVDLASNPCTPSEGTFYAGSTRRAVSSGCTYITVEATCMPQTCDPPLPLDEAGAALPAAAHPPNLLPLVIGVSVGSGVLILSLLAGFVYLRKRLRDAALRLKYSDGGFADFGDEPLTTDDDSSSYELDFSSHSSTVLGGGHSPGAAARASVFFGRASTLFSRSPRSAAAAAAAARHGSVAMLPEGASASAAMFAGSWAPLSPAAAVSHAAMALRPGEALRQQGAARFSDKYGGSSGSAVATGSAGDAGSSVHGGGASGMGHGIAYNNAAYSITSTTAPGAGVATGDSGAFAGRASMEISASQVELVEEAENANYHLSRLSSRLGAQGFGGTPSSGVGTLATPVGLRGRSSALPRPAPAMTPSTGRVSVAHSGGSFGGTPSSVHFAGGARLGLGGGAAAIGGPELYDPQAVPENDIAFINPLAMLGDSSEEDSSVADGAEYRASALSGRGVGPLPQRAGSVVAAARAPPPAWSGIGRGGREAAVAAGVRQAAYQPQRYQQSFGYMPDSEDYEEDLLTSTRRQRSVAASAPLPNRPPQAAPAAAVAAQPATPSPVAVAPSPLAAGSSSAGASTLVIPTMSSPWPQAASTPTASQPSSAGAAQAIYRS